MDGNLGRLELDELEQEPPGTRQERVQDDMPGLSIQTSNDNVQYQVRYSNRDKTSYAQHSSHALHTAAADDIPPLFLLLLRNLNLSTMYFIQTTILYHVLSPWLASPRLASCLAFLSLL